MKHIGAVLDGDFAELRRMAESRAAESESNWLTYAAEHGWSPDVSCRACGDTGVRPDWNRVCERCDVAVRLRHQRDLVESWQRTVPARFRDYRLDSSPCPQAAAKVTAWVAAGGWTRGENLILIGPVGTGKTGLLVGAVHAIWDTGARPVFAGVPMMLDRMRPGGDDDAMTPLIGTGVLALDDLGAEKATDWVRERLYVLVNGRYEAQRPTLVTTNCSLGDLAEAIGERTVSRLQEGATVVPVVGPDHRR